MRIPGVNREISNRNILLSAGAGLGVAVISRLLRYGKGVQAGVGLSSAAIVALVFSVKVEEGKRGGQQLPKGMLAERREEFNKQLTPLLEASEVTLYERDGFKVSNVRVAKLISKLVAESEERLPKAMMRSSTQQVEEKDTFIKLRKTTSSVASLYQAGIKACQTLAIYNQMDSQTRRESDIVKLALPMAILRTNAGDERFAQGLEKALGSYGESELPRTIGVFHRPVEGSPIWIADIKTADMQCIQLYQKGDERAGDVFFTVGEIFANAKADSDDDL